MDARRKSEAEREKTEPGDTEEKSENLPKSSRLRSRVSLPKQNAQSIEELYQAAKKEGALSLNGGGPAGLYEPWVREFEQRFPGIKVKLTADFSIDREIAERRSDRVAPSRGRRLAGS